MLVGAGVLRQQSSQKSLNATYGNEIVTVVLPLSSAGKRDMGTLLHTKYIKDMMEITSRCGTNIPIYRTCHGYQQDQRLFTQRTSKLMNSDQMGPPAILPVKIQSYTSIVSSADQYKANFHYLCNYTVCMSPAVHIIVLFEVQALHLLI